MKQPSPPFLTRSEQEILRRRFGLEDGLPPQTLEQVGEILQLSKQRVSQIQAAALAKLKRFAPQLEDVTDKKQAAMRQWLSNFYYQEIKEFDDFLRAGGDPARLIGICRLVCAALSSRQAPEEISEPAPQTELMPSTTEDWIETDNIGIGTFRFLFDRRTGKPIFTVTKNDIAASFRDAQQSMARDKPGSNPDVGIDEMDLSVRAYNCLKTAGISTLGQLTQLSEADLLKLPSFGVTSLLEVKGELADWGLALREPEGPAI